MGSAREIPDTAVRIRRKEQDSFPREDCQKLLADCVKRIYEVRVTAAAGIGVSLQK